MKLRHHLLRHAIGTFAGAVGVLVVAFLINPLLNYMLTGSIPDPLVDAPAGRVLSCLSTLWIVFVIAPTAALGEIYVLGRLKGPSWVKHTIVILAFPIEGLAVCSAVGLAVGGANPEALPFLGIGLLVAGTSYWVAYRAALRIVPTPQPQTQQVAGWRTKPDS